ncbi:ABC transporter permease [Candidatus Protofrankia californiensis]|uniref:ABC transporter permease n=1 Tax=Candidatus Protofrankia californiensis TaxID=1839754 RepID=UPI001F4946AE|nr:ABC transporter permease [Candidatus Protofrankia californiensis]
MAGLTDTDTTAGTDTTVGTDTTADTEATGSTNAGTASSTDTRTNIRTNARTDTDDSTDASGPDPTADPTADAPADPDTTISTPTGSNVEAGIPAGPDSKTGTLASATAKSDILANPNTTINASPGAATKVGIPAGPDSATDILRSRPLPAERSEFTASAGSQLWWLTVRHLHSTLRQPAYLAITIVQAVVWLPLFGSLFRRVVDVPGFGGGSYFDFLTPGVVVMSALFSAGWSGMNAIIEIDRGVTDRMLTSPVRRGALIGSRLVFQVIVTIIQSVIIMLLGWAIGARYHNGLLGPAVLLAGAALIAVIVASLSYALALIVRREEVLIAAVNFCILPLTFLSSAIMAKDLMPGWMQAVAWVNPVDWAVTAVREVGSVDPDWLSVGLHLSYLAALALVAGRLATRAFDVYHRSL